MPGIPKKVGIPTSSEGRPLNSSIGTRMWQQQERAAGPVRRSAPLSPPRQPPR
jgi:hypothetical protein